MDISTRKEIVKNWFIENRTFLKINNIEKELGISHNTISRSISNNKKVQRELPNKWVEPLEIFIENNLKLKANILGK